MKCQALIAVKRRIFTARHCLMRQVRLSRWGIGSGKILIKEDTMKTVTIVKEPEIVEVVPETIELTKQGFPKRKSGKKPTKKEPYIRGEMFKEQYSYIHDIATKELRSAVETVIDYVQKLEDRGLWFNKNKERLAKLACCVVDKDTCMPYRYFATMTECKIWADSIKLQNYEIKES